MFHGSARPLIILTFALIALFGVASVRAQDASAWDLQSHAAARLIAGSLVKTKDATFFRAGIELRLDPGWKTYWRDPGDSGVPPTFDFSGSENVKTASVMWPAPEQFPDGAGGHSIGYVDDIVLPLRITPKDAAIPTLLHLRLGYAVCGKLCIPAQAELQLALAGNGGGGAGETMLEKAESRVPKRVELGARPGLAIVAVHRKPGDKQDQVVVDVDAPAGAPVALFVEGPTPDWSLPLPEPDVSATATRRFSFALDGLPPNAHAEGATLTFTAVSNSDAIEVPARLD
jgi:DsbC/DsbD-like thiol-disulfide interchange protein